jgi:hypothetical protein
MSRGLEPEHLRLALVLYRKALASGLTLDVGRGQFLAVKEGRRYRPATEAEENAA